MSKTTKTFFAPQLYIRRGTKDITFYKKALGAEVVRQWLNDDDTVHVAELSIDGTVFHLHEESSNSYLFEPGRHNGVTVLLGLFVEEVDEFMRRAADAGAEIVQPAQSYDYGYRQGILKDPFGHLWMIEKKI